MNQSGAHRGIPLHEQTNPNVGADPRVRPVFKEKQAWSYV